MSDKAAALGELCRVLDDAVDEEVARRYGDAPELAQAQEQARRVGRLLASGELRPWLGVAVATSPVRNAQDTPPN